VDGELRAVSCSVNIKRCFPHTQKAPLAILKIALWRAQLLTPSITRSQARVTAWVVCTVELEVAAWLAAQRRRTHQNRCQMVGRLGHTQVVAHADQDFLRVGADAEGVHVGQIRQPLLVKARGVHGFLHVHAVVDHVHDGVRHGGDDAATAGCADHHHGLAVFGDDGGAHRA
jgi:hypothetical protein